MIAVRDVMLPRFGSLRELPRPRSRSTIDRAISLSHHEDQNSSGSSLYPSELGLNSGTHWLALPLAAVTASCIVPSRSGARSTTAC
jgi:hypothetical protein